MGIEDGLEEAAAKASKAVSFNEIGDKEGDGGGDSEKETQADDNDDE
jgi:hypothetical protein